MCKIVYNLTGEFSSLLFKGYAKLNDSQKLEWNNRGISTFHAIVAAVISFYLLLLSDLFDEGNHVELVIFRWSTLSESLFGISIGYFLSDLAMILWTYPALGGVEYLLHHGLSLIAIVLSLISGQVHIYILMVLFSEITTPFVNLRWYLDLVGQKSSKLYLYNGVALFFGWLVARVILFIYFFYHMFVHFDQVKQMFPLGYYCLLSIPSTLTLMNFYWFWKITKGMIKALSKARHRP